MICQIGLGKFGKLGVWKVTSASVDFSPHLSASARRAGAEGEPNVAEGAERADINPGLRIGLGESVWDGTQGECGHMSYMVQRV